MENGWRVTSWRFGQWVISFVARRRPKVGEEIIVVEIWVGSMDGVGMVDCGCFRGFGRCGGAEGCGFLPASGESIILSCPLSDVDLSMAC